MKNKSGYAAITLLMFVVIASTITIAATTIVNNNNLATNKFSQSIQTYYLAESGLEEGLLNYLRNPNYIGTTASVNFGDGTINISISADKKTMTSTATIGNFRRSINTSLDYSNNLQINSWQEKF